MADRSRPPARRSRALAAGLLAVAAAELAIAAVAALTSGISWAAAVASFTVTNGAMGLGFAVCGVLLAWHRPGNPVGWLFLAAALADAMSAAAIQLTAFGAERGLGSRGAQRAGLAVHARLAAGDRFVPAHWRSGCACRWPCCCSPTAACPARAGAG